MTAKEEYKHITVRMPVDILEKIEKLAKTHHRDRSGEIIHACALYAAAYSGDPDNVYAQLFERFLEEQKEKNECKNPDKWVKVEEGWID